MYLHLVPTSPLPTRLVAVALLGASLLVGAGCSTSRTLEIVTDPPGATIWVDQVKQAGVTPVEIPFTHYRYFDVRVEKPGFVPVATQLRVPTELDGYPLVDLPLELTGGRKRWTRTIELTPLPPRPGPAQARATLEDARAFADRAREEAARGVPRR